MGANSKALSSQGLMPKSTSKGAQGARDSTRRGDEEDGNTTIGETVTARQNDQSVTQRSATTVGWKAAVDTSEDEESRIEKNSLNTEGIL